MTPLTLSSSQHRRFARLALDLERVFGPRFVALVAYGTTASAAFADDIRAGDLEALSVLVPTWHRERLETPLVLSPDEFQRSLDAFPLEYQAILDRHVVIAGHPPFAGVSVAAADLRRGCEAQARGHLLHLRQGWLQAEGHEDHLAELVERSGPPFRALLANVARLEQAPDGSDASLVRFAVERTGMAADLAAAILELDARPHEGAGRALVARLPEYLVATERLWNVVDGWTA